MTRLVSVCAATAFGLVTSFALSGPAQADAYDCAGWKPNNYSYSVKCTNGTGTYRAYSKCKASVAFDYTDYGSTVRVGQVSTAVCSRASIKDKAVAPQGAQIMS